MMYYTYPLTDELRKLLEGIKPAANVSEGCGCCKKRLGEISQSEFEEKRVIAWCTVASGKNRIFKFKVPGLSADDLRVSVKDGVLSVAVKGSKCDALEVELWDDEAQYEENPVSVNLTNGVLSIEFKPDERSSALEIKIG